MASVTWRAHLDKYAAEPDSVLAKKGKNFLLTIGAEAITITPQACCAGKPYVLPLSMVKEAKSVGNKYSMPSLVIVAEKSVPAPVDDITGEVPLDADGNPYMVAEQFVHKFFVEGAAEEIQNVCDKTDAQLRLLNGQVLVAGWIDPLKSQTVGGYFSPADAKQLFETESAMITCTIGETKTITLSEDGGAVRFTRLAYGTDVVLAKDVPDWTPASIFIEQVHSIQLSIPVYETKVINNAGDEVTVFRVARNKPGEPSPAQWTVTLDPKAVIAAPYLAGLNRKAPGAARPRAGSFVTRMKSQTKGAPVTPKFA